MGDAVSLILSDATSGAMKLRDVYKQESGVDILGGWVGKIPER